MILANDICQTSLSLYSLYVKGFSSMWYYSTIHSTKILLGPERDIGLKPCHPYRDLILCHLWRIGYIYSLSVLWFFFVYCFSFYSFLLPNIWCFGFSFIWTSGFGPLTQLARVFHVCYQHGIKKFNNLLPKKEEKAVPLPPYPPPSLLWQVFENKTKSWARCF